MTIAVDLGRKATKQTNQHWGGGFRCPSGCFLLSMVLYQSQTQSHVIKYGITCHFLELQHFDKVMHEILMMIIIMTITTCFTKKSINMLLWLIQNP